MIKVLSIFGTRPEASKMAPIIKELEKREGFQSIVCVTAQHRQMLDQVLEIFDIKPDYDLNIMKQSQTLVDITVNALSGLQGVISEVNPDLVLVHGDTSTTFAGALATFYAQKKLGHVEAGLRTYDKYQPFPEEINRVLTTDLADINFAPTELAKENLLKENVNPNSIFITGNTAIDCLKTTIKQDYIFNEKLLNTVNFKNKRIITVSAHRRENLGEPLVNICKSFLDIVNNYDDVEIVYTVHLNPAVQKTVHEILGNNKKIHLINPIDLKDMHNLLYRSYVILTDSGGLQEEVPSMDKPVVVLRNVTERPEGIKAGTLKLVGTDRNNITKTVYELLDNKQMYDKMANAKNPFGDGNAAARIVDVIGYYFNLTNERPVDYI